jgi:hypothetical protein
MSLFRAQHLGAKNPGETSFAHMAQSFLTEVLFHPLSLYNKVIASERTAFRHGVMV